MKKTLIALLVGFIAVSTRQPLVRGQAANAFEGARVAHIGVIVKDVEKSAKAYSEIFGVAVPAPRPGKVPFPPSFTGDRESHPKFTVVPAANATIELLEPIGGASPWRAYLEKYGDGLHHIAFYVKDVLAAVAQLKALGGTHEMGGVSGVSYAYVNMRDQLGFTVEVLGMDLMPANAPAAPPAQSAAAIVTNRVNHVGIFVPDVVKVATLFSKVVGMPVPEAREYPGIEFPKSFTGDPQAHPKIITFPMNVGIEFAEPKGGASPWSDFVKKFGPAMQHLGMPGRGTLPQSVASLEKLGGRVLLTAPGGGSVFVDLKPQPLGLAIEVGRPPQPQ